MTIRLTTRTVAHPYIEDVEWMPEVGDVLDVQVVSVAFALSWPFRHVRVTPVRLDLSEHYHGELVWVEGVWVDEAGKALGQTVVEVLVRCAALP